MSKRIVCPRCGAGGQVADESVFELRGQYCGKAVRKCRRCGAGLLVPLFFGKAAAISDADWLRMEDIWRREVASRFPGINQPRPSTTGTTRISEAEKSRFNAKRNAANTALRSAIANEPIGATLKIAVMPNPKSGNWYCPDPDATPISVLAKVAVVRTAYGERRDIVFCGHEPGTADEWGQIAGVVSSKTREFGGEIIEVRLDNASDGRPSDGPGACPPRS